MDYVYEFKVTDCIYESAMATVSLHKTAKGAYKAMRDYLEAGFLEWREFGILHGKQMFKFNEHGWHKIVKTKLLE